MRIRDYFIRHPDGSWEPRQQATIQGPNGSVTLNPGTRFRQGVLFMGVDIAALCEQNAEV